MLSNIPPDNKIGFGNIAKPDLRPGELLTMLSEAREQLALINRDTNFIESAVEFGVTVQTLSYLDSRKPISYFCCIRSPFRSLQLLIFRPQAA